MLEAPFPYFGGKRLIASRVWAALGQPRHYIEPFFGSGAVLLARPNFNPQRHVETICDKDGFVCCAPGTRILRSDLRYVPIETLKIGDRLLAFDEYNDGPRFKQAPSGYRHWRIATVLAAKVLIRKCVRLTFNDGTTVVCSEDHQWLSGGNRGLRWRTTKNWYSTIPRTNQRAWVFKPLPVIDPYNDHIHGWLGGFADGEGHYKGSARGGGGSWGISLHQTSGPTADKCYAALLTCGYKVRREVRSSGRYKPVESLHILGGMTETFRFLMECRPERLIVNLLKGIDKKSLYTRQGRSRVFVVEMERLGNCEVIALQTTTGTYVAEGLASHNCNVWRALQFSPDETARWCDWPVNHADLTARKAALIANEGRLLERLCADDKWHDPVMAGYWIWAASCWIGGGLTRPGQIPHVASAGRDVHKLSQIPHVGDAGKGVHKLSNRPHIGTAGQGVHKLSKRPQADEDKSVTDPYNMNLYRWFRQLSERLRHVRVVCGDWKRVCGGNWQTHCGPCGIFFDPPYGVEAKRNNSLYHIESETVADEVAAWALERGDNPGYRIVLAGYEGEHEGLEAAGWRKMAWKAGMGYSGSVNQNRKRERLWFSPHCARETFL